MKDAIKVGVITDQTGPLSFAGVANANVARMVIDDLNAQGGLLGRRVELILEDSATIDSVAEAKATKLVQYDNVDVIFEYFNMLDVGSNGGAVDLASTTVTQAPTLISLAWLSMGGDEWHLIRLMKQDSAV